MEFETIIGLEIHARLNTKTKMFCGCDNNDWQKIPNSLICPVCAALPGALPLPNSAAFEKAKKLAQAISAIIPKTSNFDRKSYFYPDSPAGYQITQETAPVLVGGEISFRTEFEKGEKAEKQTENKYEAGKHKVENQKNGIVRIHHAHLENDAGKSWHESKNTFIDLNRVGSPLLEIVTQPDLRSPADAASFLRELQRIVRFLGISDAEMSKGEFKADCSISLRPVGSTDLPKYRTEIKNINSFAFARDALEYERQRQEKILREGGELFSETHGFNPATGKTFVMRGKEDAADYRYFHEPDILSVFNDPCMSSSEFSQCDQREHPENIGGSTPQNTKIKNTPKTELPFDRAERFVHDFGIHTDEANSILDYSVDSTKINLADVFEIAAKTTGEGKMCARWCLSELHGLDGAENHKLNTENLTELINLIKNGKISGKIAKEIFPDIAIKGESPTKIVAKKGLKQNSDSGELKALLEKLIAENPDQAEKARENPKLRQWFVGQIMKSTGGQANPQIVQKLLGEIFN